MNFTDFRETTLESNMVIFDGQTREITTPLNEDILFVQWHRGRDFLIEEPLMEKVKLSKYQYALDELKEILDLEAEANV